MKFGGQMSKNIHDSWKVFHEITLSVLEYFVEFYEFIFNEIYKVVPKLVYDYIHLSNFWVKFPKDK